MADRKIVMISSTARDLPEHRDYVRIACEIHGFEPREMMEHLTASDSDAVAASLGMVANADIYIGIFGHRYGYIPNGSDISITEMEYRKAEILGKTILCFIMHEKHEITGNDFDVGPEAIKLKKLKDEIKQKRVVAFFRSAHELRAQVGEALSKQIASASIEHHMEGLLNLKPIVSKRIAVRSTLRLLPKFSSKHKVYDGFNYWKQQSRAQYLLDLFRCFQAAWLNCHVKGYADQEVRNAVSNAATICGKLSLDTESPFIIALLEAITSAAIASNPTQAAGPTLKAVSMADEARTKPAFINDMSHAQRAVVSDDILAAEPLWPTEILPYAKDDWDVFESSAHGLEEEFDVWVSWYEDRLDGKGLDFDVERDWAVLSKERLSQSPREINAYLKALRAGVRTHQFRHVRAIFLGHGEVGKTSLIKALHGEDVVERERVITRCPLQSHRQCFDAGAHRAIHMQRREYL